MIDDSKVVYKVRTQGTNKVGKSRIRWNEIRQMVKLQRISWCKAGTVAQDGDT